jgi:PKD repeat protein
MLAVLLLLAGALGGTSVADAAETVVGFDPPLKAGELVTNQYEGQGLKLGYAGEFGQGSPEKGKEGDCGPPTVAKEAGIAAASAPNYAILQTCVAAGPEFSGTYGALLGRSSKALSVEVRNLTVGTPDVEIQLIAYNSADQELASAKGEATTNEWKRVALLLGGAGKASFFIIRTAKASAPAASIGIDNLGFEPASEEPGSPPPPGESPTPGQPPGGGNPSPTLPTATLSLQTPNPAPGQAITLSGAGSQAGGGHIIGYGWDLNGDGKTDTSTGTNPIVHLILAPGVHTIGLTVTNSNGQSSSSKLGVTIPTHISLPPPADGGEGPCEPTLEVGDARILAECIQKLSGGGYAIESRQLALNGMVLAPKEGGYGVFKVQTVKDFAIDGTATQLSGTPVNVELLNTPIGDMVLGERDLQAEPMNLEAHSALNQLKVPFYHGLRSPHARAADEKPSKTLLMAIGVGKPCEGKESKKAGCCPPKNALTACAELPGGFPLEGQIDVYLTNKGQALFDVQVGLSLSAVKFEATGALEIEANLETGIELQSLQFEIPEASLAPIFKVKKASFVYCFPEYYEESKRDSWQAKATITFGEELAELEAELAFKKGEFQSAAMKFKADPGVPIYPGVNLNEIGASVGVHPLIFGGSLGAKIAELLELEMAFQYREETKTELGFFGGEGKLSLRDDEIATLAADVYSDGYVDAQVKFNLRFPFESTSPVIEVSGGAGFWDEPSSGLWQAHGNVYFKLWIISAEAAALINNKYAAACIHGGAEGVFGGGVQGRYRFSDGNIDGGLYGNDNCSDQLKQYSEKAEKEHKGGFVKEESAIFLPGTGGSLMRWMGALGGRGVDALGGASGTAHAAGGETIALPNGTLGQELRITSSSGTPVVTLSGPGGQTFTTPSTVGHLVTAPGFMSAVAPDPHQVLVLLRHPKGGTWQVAPAPGAPPISKLEVAEDVAPATVRVRVGHHRGAKWSLTYKIGHFIPGTKVQFVERGSDSTHMLGTVSRASGKLSFTPQEALGRSRKIYAYLLNNEGAAVRELTVGHYTAPGPFRPARPRKLRFTRRGTSAVISWGAVAGARSYRIEVRGSDGRLETFFGKPRSRGVELANVLPFESFTATITATGGPNMLPGPAATVGLRAVKPPRPTKRPSARKRRTRKHV